jgi:hypothetical protein
MSCTWNTVLEMVYPPKALIPATRGIEEGDFSDSEKICAHSQLLAFDLYRNRPFQFLVADYEWRADTRPAVKEQMSR